MRLPAAWKDPAVLDLLKGTAINCLLIESGSDQGSIAARARQEGIVIVDAASPPPDVTVVEGGWPGVKLTESGAIDRAAAGPTGAPWVDSNGWKIRLAAALHPGSRIWLGAHPQKPRLFAESYVIGIADAAVHGGRWIISLDDQLTAGLSDKRPEALRTWQKMAGAAAFFAARRDWAGYRPEAMIGIVSDFTGPNVFMTYEILNLVARTNQQYRILLKDRITPSSLRGLRAVIYADEQPPAPALRGQILTFVEAGGMLITGPKWGTLPGARSAAEEHPRYSLRILGKGRVAIATPDFEDPYLVANDSAVLVSHRYELLRFWNVGALGSFFTVRPDGTGAVVQMLFYSAARFGNLTMRVAGQYRAARLWTLDQPAPAKVEMEAQKDAVELHLPPLSQYAAVEFEVGPARRG